jgi:hypothetical protein
MMRKDATAISDPMPRDQLLSHMFLLSNWVALGKKFRRIGTFLLVGTIESKYTNRGASAIPNKSPVINLTSFVLVLRPIH